MPQTDEQTGGLTGRFWQRQTDRQADRQTESLMDGVIIICLPFGANKNNWNI